MKRWGLGLSPSLDLETLDDPRIWSAGCTRGPGGLSKGFERRCTYFFSGVWIDTF